MIQLSDFSDIELLRELIRRNGHAQAPTRTVRTSAHREVIVGIGRDHVANLILSDEAMEAVGCVAMGDAE